MLHGRDRVVDPLRTTGVVGPTDAGERRALRRLLRVMSSKARTLGVTVFDAQPVVQFCPAARYPAWLSDWRGDIAPDVPSAWPAELPDDGFAALFVAVAPLHHAPAALAAARPAIHPTLLAAPLPPDLSTLDVALRLTTRWLRMAGPGQAARLAPPIIEHLTVRDTTNRTTVDFGERWPLPSV